MKAMFSKRPRVCLSADYSDETRNFDRGEEFYVVGHDGPLVRLVQDSYEIRVLRGYVRPVLSF